jgi:pimeloyl-ACP methyl ester carboxylesterase
VQAGKGFLEVGGQRLEYSYWSGQTADAPTLMLLHEGLGCVAMWRDFPAALNATTGLAVFAWSRAGYGGSDPARLPRPLSYMHDEARDVMPVVLDAAGFSSVIVIGHSDGASIAAIHAGMTQDARLKGLVLIAPHFFVEDISIRSIAAARVAYTEGDLRDRLKRYHGENTDCAFRGWNDAWQDNGFLAWDIREYLPRICVPVLGLQGRDDPYGTLKQIDALCELVPGRVERMVLEDCGHSPHREQPEASVTVISEFIAKIG